MSPLRAGRSANKTLVGVRMKHSLWNDPGILRRTGVPAVRAPLASDRFDAAWVPDGGDGATAGGCSVSQRQPGPPGKGGPIRSNRVRSRGASGDVSESQPWGNHSPKTTFDLKPTPIPCSSFLVSPSGG